MAKKSTATRQANAARRSQTTAKPTGATLVRAPHEQGAAATGTVATQAAPVRAPKPASAPPVTNAGKPHAAPVVERPRSLEAPKSAKPAPRLDTAPARSPNARTQASRVARARATQRARAASIITPEHYSYVLKDLRLIAGLALAMFLIIVVLHFVLG
ncbi:MAG TPA: hypothetical protein VKQ30_25500 [Ktedonobacterales bacterium]|nr:hypothetical protein [Ktedonobacterales bacterium]